MANIEEKVENLLKPTIENLGYELYDVIYEKEAQDYYLRVFIDTQKGISLNDCEKVNDAISDILDEANYIKDAYFLEVSSPGIERLLRKDKHFQDNLNKKVEINLFSPISIEKAKLELINNQLSANSTKQEKLLVETENNNTKKKNKKQKVSTNKQIEGILKSFDSEKIVLTIEEQEKTLEIPRKNIANIKLKYEWE